MVIYTENTDERNAIHHIVNLCVFALDTRYIYIYNMCVDGGQVRYSWRPIYECANKNVFTIILCTLYSVIFVCIHICDVCSTNLSKLYSRRGGHRRVENSGFIYIIYRIQNDYIRRLDIFLNHNSIST